MSSRDSVRRHPFRVTVRFLAGRPLDGTRHTDASFRRPGWTPVTEGRYLSRFDYWAGWQVAAARLCAVATVVLGVWHAFTVAAVVAAHGRQILDGAVILWVVRVRGWRMRRQIVYPLASALRGYLRYGAELPVRRWLRVPRSVVMVDPLPPVAWASNRAALWRDTLDAKYAGIDGRRARLWRLCRAGWRKWTAVRETVWGPVASWFRARAVVNVVIPHSLGSVDSKTRQAVEAGAAAKLGGEWEAQWKLKGRIARLRMRPRPEPPKRVLYAAFRERMEACAANVLAIGLTAGYKTGLIDLDDDSPHVLVSMGSGAGKSVLVRLLAAQAIRKGWAIIVLDFKQDHYWAADLMDEEIPGVIYIRKVEEIHSALIKLEQVRKWRSDVSFETRKDPVEMQRVLIVFEEMNATVAMLRTYWQSVLNGKGKSPALIALGQLSAAGRSAFMNIVAIGQYLTADVFGGPAARENFGSRLLGRYTANAWRLLVPEYGPPPSRSTVRGRIQICQGGGVPVETQVAFLTHEEVREYALTDYATVVRPRMLPFTWEIPSSIPEALSHISPRVELSTSVEGPAATPVTAEMYDLKTWVEREVIKLPYDTVRKRRLRQQEKGKCSLPADRNVYTQEEVESWLASR